MTVLDLIFAKGHENIHCNHKTTIEITKDNFLTPKGDCILGIKASKACNDLNRSFIEYLLEGNKVQVIIKYKELNDFFFGFGNKNLLLQSKDDIVFRKSNFICDRTVLINCTKSSSELSRELVKKIRETEGEFLIIFKKVDLSG